LFYIQATESDIAFFLTSTFYSRNRTGAVYVTGEDQTLQI